MAPKADAAGGTRAETTVRELRLCPQHGLILFHRYRRGPNRFIWRCKRCVGEAVTRRHRKVRAILIAEAGGCCAACGYDACQHNLHFHHVDPTRKSFEMNMGRGKSLTAYREEAKKCVLVCANCHGEIEAGLRACPLGSDNRRAGS